MNFLDVTNENSLQQLTKHLMNGVNVFVLIYMNGCGPCNATKPHWHNLKKKKWNNTIVSQIDKDLLEKKTDKDKFHLKDVSGFPTIRHYSKEGKKDYKGERNSKSFEDWITSSLPKSMSKSMPNNNDTTAPNEIFKGHFSKRARKGGRKKRRRTRKTRKSRF